MKADGHTEVVVPFSKSTAAKVRIAELELAPHELEILNEKRQAVFRDVLDKYLLRIGFSSEDDEDHSARGLGFVVRFLQRLDYEMISHAKQMTTCKQWGVCSSIMVQSGIGFLRAFAAAGASVSWDNVTHFGSDKWEKSKYVDLEFGKYAYSPAVILLAGYKFVVHFDMVKGEPTEEFETHYRLASPIQIEGEDTFGAGARAVIGLPGFPLTLGMKYKTQNFRHRYDNVIERTCEFMLNQKTKLVGHGETADRAVFSNRLADGVPEDIQ